MLDGRNFWVCYAATLGALLVGGEEGAVETGLRYVRGPIVVFSLSGMAYLCLARLLDDCGVARPTKQLIACC